jgi:hypothetical protein
MLHMIGAVLYGLWGALHVLAGLQAYRQAMTVEAGEVRGRLLQNAWNLGIVAVVAVVVAGTMNWHNSHTGYWINLVAVSATDIGFVLFVLLPKHIAFWPGILGPVLWVLGVGFSTWGLVAEKVA